MDPTWSRDGKQIAFGGEPVESSDIRVLDVNTHQVSTVPGSKGLFSPRWSPDGHYLAALSFASQKLMLSDLKKQKWAVWVEGRVAYPNWSWDSKYIFFDGSTGDYLSYRTVKLGETTSQEVVSLKGPRRYFSWQGTWSGITPDRTPLFVRDTSSWEIYALELQ